MTLVQLLGAAVVIVVAGCYYIAVRSARKHQWDAKVLVALSALSGGALVLMVLTDWPSERLARFWADHSILAAIVSSLLLVSVAYLAFEAGETAKQAELSRSVSSAGLSGLVDHLVDVDIALALLARERAPTELVIEDKPLRWVRPIRERLQAGDGPPSETLFNQHPVDWRNILVDQCIRRIIAGMRDWAALVGISEDGRLALIRLGQLRFALVDLQHELSVDQATLTRLKTLRTAIQLFAVGLEQISTPGYSRPGLTNFMPNGPKPEEVDAAVHAIRQVPRPSVASIIHLLDKRGYQMRWDA